MKPEVDLSLTADLAQTTCASCGCTDDEPCFDADGRVCCSWAAPEDVQCSRCRFGMPGRRGSMTDWTGPRDADLAPDGVTLKAPVPPERWPYCWPAEHQDCCGLHSGGLFCDYAASAEDE